MLRFLNVRMVKILMMVALMTILSGTIGSTCTSQDRSANIALRLEEPSVRCLVKLGLTGAVGACLTGKLSEDEPEMVFVGTEDGLYAISSGTLHWYVFTPCLVSHIALIDDVTGDNRRDIVICLADTTCGPSLRCYSGFTGEEVWQSGPTERVFVSDMGWGSMQPPVTDVAVIPGPASHLICIAGGRSVFAIKAGDGDLEWTFEAAESLRRLAHVGDIDSDGRGDLIAGSDAGFIYLLNGATGGLTWRERIGGEYLDREGSLRVGGICDAVTYDYDTGKVLVAASDGEVRLFDLIGRKCLWERSTSPVNNILNPNIQTTPDATGDGLPDILTGMTLPDGAKVTVVLLDGADGTEVWRKDIHRGYCTGLVEGKPVVLEPLAGLEVRLIDLGTGEIRTSLSVRIPDEGNPRLSQSSDGDYLVFSDLGDVESVSSSGATLWHYPRLVDTTLTTGRFTADGALDLLVCGWSKPPAAHEVGIRLVSAVEQGTHRELWRYEMAYADFVARGGLSEIFVTPDLDGDGIDDIAAHRGSNLVWLSGADGALEQFDCHASITHLEPISGSCGTGAILVSTENGVMVLNTKGEELWRSSHVEWDDGTPDTARVLGDLNGDGVSDIAIFSDDRITVIKSSTAKPLSYEPHRLIMVSETKAMASMGLAPDIDGDGVEEIAYIEYEKEALSPADTERDQVVLVVSPSSGETWLRLNLKLDTLLDLACADFNGDGFRDSLVYWGQEEDEPAIQPGWSQEVRQTKLEIFSGKDGSILWSTSFEDDYWQTGVMPGAPITDISGDGIDELAVTEIMGNAQRQQVILFVYDICEGTLLKRIVVPPVQEKDSFEERLWAAGPGPGYTVCPVGDLDGDGFQELATLATHDKRPIQMSGRMVVADICRERVVAYFPVHNMEIAFFCTGEAHVLGLVGLGGVYFLRTEDTLQVTLHPSGGIAGSTVRVAWKGGNSGDVATVFVDGVRDGMTTSDEIELSVPYGEHQVVIRSTDKSGRISYVVVTFNVGRKVPWVPVLTVTAVVGLLLIYSSARFARWQHNRRAQRIIRHVR